MINFLTSLQPILTDLQAYSSLPSNIHRLTQCHRQLLHQHIERELVYDKKEDTWFLYKYCSLKMSYSLTFRHTSISHPASTIGSHVTDSEPIITLRGSRRMTWRRTCRALMNFIV